jgi:hypothetical protein
MPSAVTACAWRLLTGTGYIPGRPPGADTVHGAPGPGHPPPARRRRPHHTDRAAADRSPRSAPASRPADRSPSTPQPPLPMTVDTRPRPRPLHGNNRAARPHADAGKPAHQEPGGINARAPPAGHRICERPHSPRPSCTPGHSTARVTTAISAPPGPGPDGMHARLSGGRLATDGPPGAARPWPSVKNRRCTPTVLAAGRRPLYVRGHRDTAVHSATR